MGACISSGDFIEELEIQPKAVCSSSQSPVKILLLGSGDSGKTTFLKQMRFIYKQPFSSLEEESYRQLIWDNITKGFKTLLDAMVDMELRVAAENIENVELIENARYVHGREPFPESYLEPLKSVWRDPNVQRAWDRRNESALPDNLSYFFGSLDRLFKASYTPSDQDIIHAYARTLGIAGTTFRPHERKMVMVDVGGQKSERRKWIHCFQDVTSIFFFVNLSGYDQCLVEDMGANQMQDAMTIWDAICHSKWFKQTPMILFLNKNDLFEQKVSTSNIRDFFPDYDGPSNDAQAGREYFKKRFKKLAEKAGKVQNRDIYT
ncbi:hypothetical protein VKT23_010269 [Stygiomarasmius scandens]|uniref:Uncharacterized protein n=1 Tax=Marasmiellus scandens TaxID=2682957 RepID=A0ABR1JDH2_9AGAR